MIVNKEIARKLRDIGFREPTDYLYNHYGEKIRQDQISGNQLYVDKGYDNSDAPDKSDVFKWFRDKGIIGLVYVSGGFYHQIFQGDDQSMGKTQKTWEEAEDLCILKMIELCNQEM